MSEPKIEDETLFVEAYKNEIQQEMLRFERQLGCFWKHWSKEAIMREAISNVKERHKGELHGQRNTERIYY